MLEEPQLKSHSRGCTCRPDSSLFQQHPRCVSRCTGCHGDGGEGRVTDCPGLTPELSHTLLQSYQAGLTSRDQKPAYKFPRVRLASMPLEASKGHRPQKACTQQKRRRVPLGTMGKGLLVIITDSRRNACDTTNAITKKECKRICPCTSIF